MGETEAFAVGLKPSEYWELNPKQYKRYIDGYIMRLRLQAKETDANNWLLGQYIALAVNSPKKYPKKPRLADIKVNAPTTPKVMTDSEIERMAYLNTIKLGGTVKHGNNN